MRVRRWKCLLLVHAHAMHVHVHVMYSSTYFPLAGPTICVQVSAVHCHATPCDADAHMVSELLRCSSYPAVTGLLQSRSAQPSTVHDCRSSCEGGRSRGRVCGCRESGQLLEGRRRSAARRVEHRIWQGRDAQGRRQLFKTPGSMLTRRASPRTASNCCTSHRLSPASQRRMSGWPWRSWTCTRASTPLSWPQVTLT